MRWYRFSIRDLMILVAAVALYTAFLMTHSGPFWSILLFLASGLLMSHLIHRPRNELGGVGMTGATATAYRQGVKNMLIGSLILLALWGALAGVVSYVSDRPLADSYWLALAVLCGLGFLHFLGTWLSGRNAGGTVLLDCGPFQARFLTLLAATSSLVLGLTAWQACGIFAPVVGIPAAIFFLIMATGRLQVREGGLWLYVSLLKWNRIDSFDWSKDSTLKVKVKHPFLPFLDHRVVLVPSENQKAVDELLQAYCPVRRAA